VAEETLKKLLVEQRHKVEELKKKTDYYSTQKLLERYDQSVRPTQPLGSPNMLLMRAGLVGSKKDPTKEISCCCSRYDDSSTAYAWWNLLADTSTPGNWRAGTQPLSITYVHIILAPFPLFSNRRLMTVSSAPSLPPPQRHWYDRVVDAVLGEDTESPHTRFALICQKCFTHNGLIREAEWEDTRTSSFNQSLFFLPFGVFDTIMTTVVDRQNMYA